MDVFYTTTKNVFFSTYLKGTRLMAEITKYHIYASCWKMAKHQCQQLSSANPCLVQCSGVAINCKKSRFQPCQKRIRVQNFPEKVTRDEYIDNTRRFFTTVVFAPFTASEKTRLSTLLEQGLREDSVSRLPDHIYTCRSHVSNLYFKLIKGLFQHIHQALAEEVPRTSPGSEDTYNGPVQEAKSSNQTTSAEHTRIIRYLINQLSIDQTGQQLQVAAAEETEETEEKEAAEVAAAEETAAVAAAAVALEVASAR